MIKIQSNVAYLPATKYTIQIRSGCELLILVRYIDICDVTVDVNRMII